MFLSLVSGDFLLYFYATILPWIFVEVGNFLISAHPFEVVHFYDIVLLLAIQQAGQ